MKLELNQKLKEALDKIGIEYYEMEDIEMVLLRMDQNIYKLRKGK